MLILKAFKFWYSTGFESLSHGGYVAWFYVYACFPAEVYMYLVCDGVHESQVRVLNPLELRHNLWSNLSCHISALS